MSVIVELSLSSDEFALGRALSVPGVRVELERLVPTGGTVVPYLWVRTDDPEAFERGVRAHEVVADLAALDRVDRWSLYRVDWSNGPTDLLAAVAESGGVVLEATSDDEWTFRLRFPTQADVSRFYGRCREGDLPVHIERSYTLAEKTETGLQFDLSGSQREALLLALERGYFDTPSGATLDDLAAELGISQQALSGRVRRGTRRVLAAALDAGGSDADGPTEV
jgi:predicted DNA binding protein